MGFRGVRHDRECVIDVAFVETSSVLKIMFETSKRRLTLERNSFKEYSILKAKTCLDELRLRFDAYRHWNRRRPNYTHTSSNQRLEQCIHERTLHV